jgi:type IV pilus assembly protein PilF
VKARAGWGGSIAARGAPVLAGSVLAICVLGVATLAACASKPKVTLPQRETQTIKPDLSEAAKYNVELGVAYMDRGDLALAKDKLERAEKEAPRDPMVHSALALLFQRLDQPSDADREFHTALRLAPHDPKIANNYAVYLCDNHRVDEGVSLLLQTAHDPLYETPEAAYTNAAVCLRSAHRDAEAKTNLLRAITLRPNFAEAVFQLASLEVQQGQLRDARARIDHFIGIYSATPDLLELGVRISRALRDPVGMQHYEQRLRVDFPDSQQTRALSQGSPNTG